MVNQLSSRMYCRAGEPLSPGAIATFSVDHKSGRELRQYLSSVADQCEHGSSELPCVIILDSLHHVTSLSEVFNGFLSVHYQTRYLMPRTGPSAKTKTRTVTLHDQENPKIVNMLS